MAELVVAFFFVVIVFIFYRDGRWCHFNAVLFLSCQLIQWRGCCFFFFLLILIFLFECSSGF